MGINFDSLLVDLQIRFSGIGDIFRSIKDDWEPVKEAKKELDEAFKDIFIDLIAGDKIEDAKRKITEFHTATINEIKKKLQEMQKSREEAKNGFREVINQVGDIDINDTHFLSKVASLLRGYTNFHLFVVTCISYCRYQILELKITKQEAEELKIIVLGLVNAGFPNNLKNAIDNAWRCTDQIQVGILYHHFKKKLEKDKDLQLSIADSENKLNEYLQRYAKLNAKVSELENAIASSS
jgi:hypothetical protein